MKSSFQFDKLFSIAILSIFLILFSAMTFAQSQINEPKSSGELEILHVQGNVWLIAGIAGNIAVQAGEQGVIVVDTGTEAFGAELIAAIRTISERPIRYLINTSNSIEHVGGNSALLALPGGSTQGATVGASISAIAHENVLFRMSVARDENANPLYLQDSWPNDGYYEQQRGLIFNGEAIDIIHMPKAHTDGDSLVYFRGSNVLVSGDIFSTSSLPMIDSSRGGSFMGSIDALDRMLDITIPDDLMEGGTYIIPGHGYISDEADLVEYRDMSYIIRDRLQKLIVEDKLKLDEVIAARPLLGWESRYNRPEWSIEMFLREIYNEFKSDRASK